VLVILLFVLHFKVRYRDWLGKVKGLLALICFCLAFGSQELTSQTLLYESNLKSAIYLMCAAKSVVGRTSLCFHLAVALVVPLAVLSGHAIMTVADDEAMTNEPGNEKELVFARHLLVWAMLVTVYFLQLRSLKANFIRGCLHEMNEKSIGDVLDKVSEPIVIVKRRHKVSMKPKYMNNAAKKILQQEQLLALKRQ